MMIGLLKGLNMMMSRHKYGSSIHVSKVQWPSSARTLIIKDPTKCGYVAATAIIASIHVETCRGVIALDT